ncbi:MAG: type II toxin-antitoxin system prevent-host-death family antitoxin [Scrofimicrobium sp.]
MTITVNVQEAKTRLSDLLRRTEAGEKVVIARAGVPVAELSGVSPRKRDLSKPLLRNLPKGGGEELLEPLGEEELRLWEDGHSLDPLKETIGKL